MKLEELKQARAELKSKLKDFEAKINEAFAEKFGLYLNENCPVKENKVYELVKNGIKRRGFSRFAIYTLEPSWLGNHLFVHAGGWWLDKNSIPKKWDTINVMGAGNSAEFILSEDQTNHPHPDSAEVKNGIVSPSKTQSDANQ